MFMTDELPCSQQVYKQVPVLLQPISTLEGRVITHSPDADTGFFGKFPVQEKIGSAD